MKKKSYILNYSRKKLVILRFSKSNSKNEYFSRSFFLLIKQYRVYKFKNFWINNNKTSEINNLRIKIKHKNGILVHFGTFILP